MKYVEAPNRPEIDSNSVSLFLAGGIQDCPDHQAYVCNKLKDSDLTVFNPRRKNFPIHNPDAAYEQIKWEYDYLRIASMISFWFCKETLCPIVLLELGEHSVTNKPLIIGVDPDYKLKQQVEVQLNVARPDIRIVYSLDGLSEEIVNIFNLLT